jgi:hypothetical protein
MHKRTVLLIILVFSISINAQNEKPERDSFVLSMALDSINYYEQEVLKSPYFVKEKIIQIYPSEKIFIEAEVKADSIYSMIVVKENLNPEKTIIVEFTQKVENRKHNGMTLSVKNPFDKTLTYEALMYLNGGTKWISTSIIPISPNLINFELWHDVILSLVLVEWKIE